MPIESSIADTYGALEWALKAKLIPMLKGSPGIGKSFIVKKLAADYKLFPIEVRLAQCDPTDLLGFPFIDKDADRARYVPMGTFPLVGDPIPAGYNGWLVFLDEFNGAEAAVQKAAYRILEKQVGNYDMHPKVAIICAGNLDTDGALVEEMSSALQSRMLHLTAVSNVDSWLNYAETSGINQQITSFINFRPGLLNNFDPDAAGEEKTYACERTWVFVDSLLKTGITAQSSNALALIAGCIGEGAAREFVAFLDMYQDLPTMSEIQTYPLSAIIPSRPGVLYALTGALAAHATENNLAALMTYIQRLPIEYQTVCLRGIARQDMSMLASVPAYQKWAIAHADIIF